MTGPNLFPGPPRQTPSHRGRPVYLDYQATTPVDPRVLDAMMPFFTEKFGNPHSRDHFYGWEAEEAVEKARCQIAATIGAGVKEIIFTSGATESNNLALKGVARLHAKHNGDRKTHIVTCATEHKCVLEASAALEREGITITYLPVGPNGLIDLDQLRDAITDNTSLVSIMGVNNEIGVIQPLADIGAEIEDSSTSEKIEGASFLLSSLAGDDSLSEENRALLANALELINQASSE